MSAPKALLEILAAVLPAALKALKLDGKLPKPGPDLKVQVKAPPAKK